MHVTLRAPQHHGITQTREVWGNSDGVLEALCVCVYVLPYRYAGTEASLQESGE